MLGLGKLARSVFGSANDRYVKKLAPKVDAISALEPDLVALSDEQLRAKTDEFRKRYAEGESLDDLLVEAFATVREAAKRALGQRHYDVQLIGGMILHAGRISEMKTGEGKTLVATAPVYLNAIAGKGVHVVTVNDYLAQRDAEWMGQVYNFLGLSVGCIIHGLSDEQRRAAYHCDVTYGTNNEFGFDYLRDNMKYSLEEMSQRGHAFAIVDEVDSILVDEARTPLIISGPTEDQSELYITVNKFIPLLSEEHYEVDEKTRAATFTEEGNEKIEEILRENDMMQGESLYDPENVTMVHHMNQALRAHKLFQRDKDYIVKGGKVVIIDEFTGRMMEGRRFSEGLHQALEAKEDCPIQPENVTLASVTFQNYFRLYDKLAGMTGTAMTEAEEFADIYGLEVTEIPTHVPVARIDADDEVYRTTQEKYNAIIDFIEECSKRGQPTLVGTTSIEKSEMLSDELKKRKVKHNVLNARYHDQEAMIVAQAGRLGAVTIATNMAGRGTDIQLGGNVEMRVLQECEGIEDPEKRAQKMLAIENEVKAERQKVLEAGGLCVLGTERHESRRIDNQLRGRSGRQGDPGLSKFFLSLDDDLMRIFGSERMDSMLQKLGLEDGEAIIHPWINRALEKAQQKVEARNFDIRKNLLKFDDVMNDQRKVIFEQRVELMSEDSVAETVNDMREQVIDDLVSTHMPPKAYAEQWDTEGLEQEIRDTFLLDLPVSEWAKEEGIANEEIRERLVKAAKSQMAQKAADFGPDLMRRVEKMILLQTLDHHWREHLIHLDHLRQVVGFRGYAQRDPLNEYKTEAFALFESLLDKMRVDVSNSLSRIQIQTEEPPRELVEAPDLPEMQAQHINPQTGENEMSDSAYTVVKRAERSEEVDPNNPDTWGKVGRNEPCPCGSGKKFKHCHGALG